MSDEDTTVVLELNDARDKNLGVRDEVGCDNDEQKASFEAY